MRGLNGGYKIINLKDTDLVSGVGVTISGTHDAIEGSYRKPLLLGNIVIGGVEKNDAFVSFTVSGGTYSTSIYGGTITVDADDVVTYIAD